MLAILSFSGSKFKDLKRIGWKIKLHLKKKNIREKPSGSNMFFGFK